MKTYEDYQPSFINGIDVIPLNWREAPIKQLVEINPESLGEKTEAELQISYIDIGNVNSYGEIEEIQQLIFKDAPSRARRIVRKGDVLVSTVRTYLKAIAAVESDEENLIASTGFAVLRADEKNVAASYLKYAVRGGYFIEAVVANSTGVSYPAISSTIFSNIKLVLPSYDEQRAIAAYLDRKTAQLDTLLAQKEALLRMLNQKRQALINEAVTQGLDPGAPRKPSGVAWLGDVPAHWEVKKLKYVMDFFNTVRVPLSAEERGLMTNPMYDYYGASGAIDKVDNYHFDGEYILLAEDGANLLSRSSPLAFKATGKFWVNNHAHILRPKDGNLDYYINLLESLDYTIYVTGSAQPKLTMGNLANVSLPVPPVQEQHEIQHYLHRISSQLMSVENQIHTQIKTLKAYRQSLISEVVTGKVDVRTAEAVA